MLPLINIKNDNYVVIITTILALVSSLIVSSLIILIIGESPITVMQVFIKNSLFGWDNIGFTLFYTTPHIFAGLAVAIAFKAGLFNIGAEGQLYIGSIATTLTALALSNWPAIILLPTLIVVAFVSGGIWGAIPGYLKVRFGSHEVINTIMLNLIAYGVANYLVVGPFKRKGDQVLETDFIPEAAQIFRLNKLIPQISENVPLNGSIFIALFVCLIYWLFFNRIKFGMEMEIVGYSPEVSRYTGISNKLYTIMAMFAAGGVAGLVATHEVLGFRYTFHDSFSGGIGFVGIAVALLGRGNAIGIILASFLFGMLQRGSLFLDIEFNTLSNDLVVVIQGIVILFVAMSGMFQKLIKV